MYKKILKSVLAFSMIIPTLIMPIHVKAEENPNLSLNATVTQSSFETTGFEGSKVADGNLSTRWGTERNKANGEWVNLDLGEEKTVSKIIIRFERSDDEQNILGYHVDIDGKTVFTKSQKASQVETITLDDPIQGQNIKVIIDNADAGTINWLNVGINEIEIYSSHEVEMTLDEVANSIIGRVIELDENQLVLPDVPSGYEIEINGCDFEQIVSDKGVIHHPLIDKMLQISYIITKTSTNETKKTNDITYMIKGEHNLNHEKNAKPVIIPEIQEWYSDSTEKLSIDVIDSIIYDSFELEAIAHEFVEDFYDFTNNTLLYKKGESQKNSIYMTLNTTDTLLGEEGYNLTILEDRIVIEASHVTGAMYGLQTLLQMYKADNSGYPVGMIRDYPRFETRGLLLDIARKPIGMNMIRDISRTMRYYKMNDLQLHLSDNYIFLENYGKYENEDEAFNAYEAFRLESGLTNEAGESPTAKDYYITKEEFRGFIEDERSLGMNIVPEIDMPAHATSFTKVWPELKVENKVSPLNGNRPLVDHLDVSRKEAVDKIKEIFDDYTKGENPTFDEDTIVHIGADEFVDNYTAYREFVNEIVPYVKETNTVRMWGGFTWIDDHKTEIAKDAIENVEMNLWSKDWADGLDMYNLGYKLINTIDDYGYMVPSGSMSRANAYGDLLNVNRIFDSFKPNSVRTRNGYVELPSGDPQVLGAAFAIWSDNIDKHSNGLTESDLYYRFFDALPFYAEKTWAAIGKEKGSAQVLADLAKQQGDGPNTNPYYKADTKGDVYFDYDFDDYNDNSLNNNILTRETAKLVNGELVLNKDDSYISTPIDKLGNGNALSFDIQLSKAPEAGDILFETTPEYGTHDIRIMSNGQLGFTRELHDYYFDYELPVNQKVNIKIVVKQQRTSLYVNNEFVCDALGQFVHNDIVKKTNITNATFALPLERIGSKTNAIEATIDNVKAIQLPDASKADKDIDPSTMSVTSGSFQPNNETEGDPNFVLDGDATTIWHSLWTGTPRDTHWLEFTFDEVTTIDGMRFMQRSGNNGNVKKFDLYVRASENDEWSKVVSEGTLDSDQAWQLVSFDAVEAKQVKFQVLEAGDNGNGILFAAAAEVRFTAVKEEPVNKDALNAKVAEVENTKADAYTKESYDAFKAALDTAKAVLADEQASQDKVDTALATLQDAYKALVKKPVEKPFPFTDVSNKQWYYGVINEAYQLGLMTGASDSLFKPNANMNRGMVAIVFHRMEGSKKVEYSKVFPDVANKQYYTTSVLWAKQTGVINGYKDGTFKPLRNVSREEMATMIYNFARYKGLDMSASKDITYFDDYNKITPYARVTLQWAVEKGLMSGKDNGTRLDPLGTATRAECSKMLVQAYKVIYK